MKNSESNTRIPGQLKEWSGHFGDEYVKRNDYADWKMEPGTKAFRQIIGGLKIESVLEVGSNIGLNLIFINALFEGNVKLYAVEPNRKAFGQLVSQAERLRLENAWNCDAFQLPLADSSIDLVFTAGVLIHIAPDNLGQAMDEIVRVARKYVLCIEYFSHEPEEKPYHGKMGLLFKRDYGSYYLDRFPNLKCLSYGFLWQREFKIFDDLTWWLFKKQRKSVDG
jgi:pseudaminic acid biosynthesis-associated methylase